MKGRDWGTWIALAALLIAIPRYIAALLPAEPNVFGFAISVFTGPGFAIVLEGGVFFVLDRLMSAWRRGRKEVRLLLAVLIVQLLISPLIVWPSIVAHLRQQTVPEVLANPQLGLLEGWAFIISAAPVILVGAATLARFTEVKPKSTEDSAKSSEVETKHSNICSECGMKIDPSLGYCYRCDLLQQAKSAGSDKKSQILFLLNSEEKLKQSDIAEILGTSQGYVSNIVKELGGNGKEAKET